MGRYLVSQLLQSLVTILGISIVVFFLIRLTGDPITAMIPPDATRADVESMRQFLGLDKPLIVQYGIWIRGVAHGDFGRAFFTGRPAALSLVLERLPATALLALLGLGLSVVVAIPAGISAAVNQGRWIDAVVRCVVLAGQALPGFWLGIMLIIVFAVNLGLVPSSGSGQWQNLVLPVITLAVQLMPLTMRIVRARMITILSEDYIRAARAKGLPKWLVMYRHALSNAGISVVTIVGTQFAYLLAGAVTVEVVFAWPGVGSLLVDSVNNSDFPVVQTGVFVIALLTVAANVLTDITVATLDPRIRVEA